MAQQLTTDFPIDPATTSGTALSQILNRFEQSVNTNNSGGTTPPDTYAGMFWLDTSSGASPSGVLKIRNVDNSGWLTIADTASPPASGAIVAGKVSKDGDTMVGDLIINKTPGTDAAITITSAASPAYVQLSSSTIAPGQPFRLTQGTDGSAVLNNFFAAPMRFLTVSVERMRIHATGQVSIGTAQGVVYGSKVRIEGGLELSASNQLNLTTGSGAVPFEFVNRSDSGLKFYASGTSHPMCLRTDGRLQLNYDQTNTLPAWLGIGFSSAQSQSAIWLRDGGSGGVQPGKYLFMTSVSAPGTKNTAIEFQDSVGQRFVVYWDGGIGNYAGANTAWSDRRLKRDIEPASEWLPKIRAIPVHTFVYPGNADGRSVLGVIAQEVEPIAPELVSENGAIVTLEGETEPTQTKAVYTDDFMYAIMKSVQELAANVDTLAARVDALEPA